MDTLGEIQILHLLEHKMTQHVRQTPLTICSLQKNIYAYLTLCTIIRNTPPHSPILQLIDYRKILLLYSDEYIKWWTDGWNIKYILHKM
jgi:hypothetical protein